MLVNLKSNFDLGMSSLDLDGPATLRRLLERLSQTVPGDIEFIDAKTNELDDFFVVSVNGQELPFLPQRLDTTLQEGDEVQVAVISFGGG